MKRILFVINPLSGHRKKEWLPDMIRASFPPEQYRLRIENTSYAGHAERLVQEAIEDAYDAVVVAGGDGSVNEAATLLFDKSIPLGIIPMGSGNGLANHLGIPKDIKKALDIIKNHKILRIDTGKINGHLFHNMAGAGFDAHVAWRFSTSKSRGLKSYINIVARDFLSYKPSSYTLITPRGSRSIKTKMISIANSTQFGNNFKIAPKASLTDGKLEVVIVKKINLFLIPVLAWYFLTSRAHKCPYVESSSEEKLTLIREKTDWIHIDGEPMMEDSRLDIEIFPKSLSIFVP